MITVRCIVCPRVVHRSFIYSAVYRIAGRQTAEVARFVAMLCACKPISSGVVFARDSVVLSALYAIAIPSVCPSVCHTGGSLDQTKTVEVRIMQFSLYSSPSLVFAG